MKFSRSFLALSLLLTVSGHTSCPEIMTMTQLKEINERGGIIIGGDLFVPESRKKLKNILPSSWTPTAYTTTAHLRSHRLEGSRLLCIYGYKSVSGNILSGIESFWKSQEDLNKELDYSFILIHNADTVMDENSRGDLMEEIMVVSEEPLVPHQEDVQKNEAVLK